MASSVLFIKKILFVFSLSFFLFCKPTILVYVNKLEGVYSKAGSYYEFGQSILVYDYLEFKSSSNYFQIKANDEYIESTAVDFKPPASVYFIIDNIKGATIYSDPDLKKAVKTLPFGFKVQFKSAQKGNRNIYLVLYGENKIAYIENANLKNQIEKEYFKVATPSGLILREKPNQKSKQLDILPLHFIGEVKLKDTKISTLGSKSGYWILTDYKENQGWIFSGFVYLSNNKNYLTQSHSREEEFNSLFEKVEGLKSYRLQTI